MYAPLDESVNARGGASAVASAYDDDTTDEKPSLRRTSQQLFQSTGSNVPDAHRQALSEPLNGEPSSQDQNHQAQSNQPQQSSDPFHMFREDLYRQLERVDESLAEYLRVVHQTDSAVNSHELKDAKKQIKRALKNAEATWHDVQTTVSLVESDRAKFSHINDKELYERSALVHTSRDRIQRAKSELQSEAVKVKLWADERAKAVRRAGASSTVLGANDAERENTALMVHAHARQSLLLQHQDDTLDELESAVTRVNTMAESIHDEIGQQNKILTQLDDDLTHVEEELGLVMGKLAKFLQTKDRWQLGTIVCLTVTVFVLFFLVVYV